MHRARRVKIFSNYLPEAKTFTISNAKNHVFQHTRFDCNLHTSRFTSVYFYFVQRTNWAFIFNCDFEKFDYDVKVQQMVYIPHMLYENLFQIVCFVRDTYLLLFIKQLCHYSLFNYTAQPLYYVNAILCQQFYLLDQRVIGYSIFQA